MFQFGKAWAIFAEELRREYSRNAFSAIWRFVVPLVPVTAYIFLRAVLLDPIARPLGMEPAVFVGVGATLWFFATDLILQPTAMVSKHSKFLQLNFVSISTLVLAAWIRTLFDLALRATFVGIFVYFFSDIGAVHWQALVVVPALTWIFVILAILYLILYSFLPDVKIVVEITFRYLIFFSGVIFELPSSANFQIINALNPLGLYVDGGRNAFVYGQFSGDDPMWYWFIGAVAATPLVWFAFVRMQSRLNELYFR